MRQVLLNLRTGAIEVAQVPTPALRRGHVLIETRVSLISAGTERMLLQFGKASMVGKARSQPERVRQVLEKLRADGVIPTVEAVFNKLDEPLPLGYCNVGRVVEVGAGVVGLEPGDRVVSNGSHGEVVCVPKLLCAKIPEGVSDENAAFTVVSSIALESIRLLEPTLGERVVVYGLGLIGLLTARLLMVNGCDVLGIDISEQRLAVAETLGIHGMSGRDPQAVRKACEGWTDGHGVDGVIIAASAKGDRIVHESAQISRKRGRIVLLGSVDLDLDRGDFYEKELSFQVSCSYGPGRYDERYEQEGQDYPFGFVRWTEQRNFEAVLGAMASGALDATGLITHRFPIESAPDAYAKVAEDPTALGVLLTYPGDVPLRRNIAVKQRRPRAAGRARVGVIGGGNYSKMTLMPTLTRVGAEVLAVCDLDGTKAYQLAEKHGVPRATTDYRTILDDPDIEAVIVAVGHSAHAALAREALEAGKHVLVEKPLALTVEEILSLREAAEAAPESILMVGFNRRFSPHVERAKSLLRDRGGPLCMNFTVNAGEVPASHWVHDPEIGGGRIVGEGCHFIDLMSRLAGAAVETIACQMVTSGPRPRDDKAIVTMTFADGSIGNLNYFANGSKAYGKERLEVFADGRVLLLENFRALKGYGFPKYRTFRTMRQDKGHARELEAFLDAVRLGKPSPIPLDEAINVTLATFAAMTAAREGRVVTLGEEYGERFATGEQG